MSNLFAQGWSNWVSFNNNKGVSAAISFLVRKGPDGISYFQTNNTYIFKGGTLFFAFDYTDDKGRAQTQTGMIDLEKSGVDKDPGYWFISNGGSVTNIRVTRIDLPSEQAAGSGSYSSSGNNSSRDNNSGSPYGSNTSDNHASQNTGSSVTGTSSNNSYNNNNSSNARSYSNRPVNFGSPATNSNTRNLAQDMQGLQQTQAYLNQQQAQLQQSTANVDNAIQGIGDAIQSARDAKYEKQAKIEEERAKDRASSLNAFGQMMYWKEAAAEKLGDYELNSVGDTYSGKIHPYKDYLNNYPKAIEWYQKAAGNGNKNAMLQLSYIYGAQMNNRELEKEWFQKYTADTSDAEVMYKLGYAYEFGIYGYSEDYAKAITYYTKAAEKGSTPAMSRLYFLYHNNKNKNEEKKWAQQFIVQLQNEADTGNIEAMDRLSNAYSKYGGRIVKRDKFKSQEWDSKYRKAKKAKEEQERYTIQHSVQQAADNGDVHAMFKLGEYYEAHDNSVFIGEEYSKAKYWYQKAAQAASH